MVKYAAESKSMNPSVLSSRDFISSLNMLYAYTKTHLHDQKVSTHTIKKGTLPTDQIAFEFLGTLSAKTYNRYAKVAQLVDMFATLVE